MLNTTYMVERYCEKYPGTSKRVIKDFVDKFTFLVCDEIINNPKKGGVLFMGRFGLKVVVKNPRESLNPKTGEKVSVPSKYVVKFRPSDAMRIALEEKSRKDGLGGA